MKSKSLKIITISILIIIIVIISIFVFTIFDNVPGGAGHVRYMAEATTEELKEVFKESLKVVEQCDCGGNSDGDCACYSCLCNYYNQKYHEILKRRYAIKYLKKILDM